MKMFRVALDLVKTWEALLLFKGGKEAAPHFRLDQNKKGDCESASVLHKRLSLIL